LGSFEQALSALAHLPETRDTREQAIDLRLALRTALYPSGDAGRILAALREAEALAAALNDHHRLGRVSVRLANHFRYRGAHDQAIVAGQRALALATSSGEVVLQALANQCLGAAYRAQGDYRRAIDYFRQTVVALEGIRHHQWFGEVTLPAVSSRARLAGCHAELGTFAEGMHLGDEGLQIAEAMAHPNSLMWAYYEIGLLSLRHGDLPRALSLLERAIGSCQETDRPAIFPAVAAALGEAYTLAGHVADAVPMLTQAMAQTISTERAHFEMLCGLSLGEAHLRAGRTEEAQALAARALALAREHQARGHQAYALHLLGDIAARCEPPQHDQAGDYFRRALALAEELGMRPLQAHCHRGLGTLYHQIGQGEQAHAELSTAIELFRSMDMTFWLPEAEAALAQVEKP
jgi:tetratricopeptide (TPR) repeat protein